MIDRMAVSRATIEIAARSTRRRDARWVLLACAASLTTLATLASTGCASMGSASITTDARYMRTMDVYNTLFDEAINPDRPVPVAVEMTTARYVAPLPDAAQEIREQLAAIPAGLSERLAAASARPRDVRSLPLPPGVRVLTDDNGATVDVARSDPPIFALSPVVFSDDGINAFVYVEQRCGPGCSGGSAIWLALTNSGEWLRQGEVTIWLG